MLCVDEQNIANLCFSAQTYVKRNNFTWLRRRFYQAFLNNSLGDEVLKDDDVLDMGAFGIAADLLEIPE